MKTVLLVEDSEDDIFFMKKACQQTDIRHQLDVVKDGDAAVEYLAASGPYTNKDYHPIPDLVFLDVKLPKRNGHEVLEWIRTRPELASLPVIMLTTSQEPGDIERAYRLGVTSYLRKSSNPADFRHAVQIILTYWLRINIPRGNS